MTYRNSQALRTPVPFAPNVENPEQGERKVLSDLVDTFQIIQDRTAKVYGHAVRAVHAKSHGLLAGNMIIDDGLLPELAQGLFEKPGRHRVFIRLSTNAGDILPDDISLPRGLALKVLDVVGDRLPDAEGQTQDFLFVNGPVFQTKTASQFLGNLRLLAKTTERFLQLKRLLSRAMKATGSALRTIGIESTTINSLGGAPNVDPLGETYFSTVPFRYGDYIAKFAIVPVSPDLVRLSGNVIDTTGRPNAIRETVQQDMRKAGGVWEFRVQLCRDLDKQPIEDPTVEWKEADTPFQRVAIIHARSQDSWDLGAVEDIDENMRFSVWTGLAAHQPLGNINRARKEPYRQAASFRARFNGCPLKEPLSDDKTG